MSDNLSQQCNQLAQDLLTCFMGAYDSISWIWEAHHRDRQDENSLSSVTTHLHFTLNLPAKSISKADLVNLHNPYKHGI